MEYVLTEDEKIASNPFLSELKSYLHWRFHLTLNDVTPTKTKGYWIINKPCGGRKAGCKHPMHSALFCEDSIQHTISFHNYPKDSRGRFQSPYLAWQCHRDHLGMEKL